MSAITAATSLKNIYLFHLTQENPTHGRLPDDDNHFESYKLGEDRDNLNRNSSSDGRHYRFKIDFWYNIKNKDSLRILMVAQRTMSVTTQMLLVMILTRRA